MNRENLKFLIGFVGLAAVGAGMLYITSGPTTPGEGTAGGKAAKAKAKAAKAATEKAPKLMFKRKLGDRVAAPEGAANLVVVTGCSVRRDALGPYGGPAALTPALNTLAQQGARFDDALATAPWTLPAMVSMFTGQHAIDLGMVEPSVRPAVHKLPPEVQTVAETLTEQGWYSTVVSASPALGSGDVGMWQGFDHVRFAHSQGWKTQHRLTNGQAVEQALRMMKQRPVDRPFYLQLVVADPHKPVRVPPSEAKPWEDEGLPNPPYMATIRRVDDAVARIDSWLETEGLADNTYLVFVADHGEGLGRPEHHGPAHGRFLAHTSIQVPWIVRGPGVPANHRIEGLASGVDVAPTLLGLLGVEGLGEVPGQDWSDRVRGAKSPTTRKVAFSDTWYHNANRAAVWTRDVQCQQDFGSVGLDDPFVDACYDRKKDPDFTTASPADAVMKQLETWRGEREVKATSARPPPRSKTKAKAKVKAE